MPWNTYTTMSLRAEFVRLASRPDANISRLCRQFNISRPTGYKWLRRWKQQGPNGLIDQSRKPHHPANQTPRWMEKLVVDARRSHKGWGGRKIKRWLADEVGRGNLDIEVDHIPSASTITAILDRHDLLDPMGSPSRSTPWKRFEYPRPNDLWQMDFKGEFALMDDSLCYPLTIIDDHSRFNIALKACANQKRTTVQPILAECFQRYGLPFAILVDNSNPWGCPIRNEGGRVYHTKLSAWLMRLGITVIHSTPGKPQGKGKNERFNGTLQAELIRYHWFSDMEQAQTKFDQWRQVYNQERPHQALGMDVPLSRYTCSSVTYRCSLPPIAYGPDDVIRKVAVTGRISFKSKQYQIGKAFNGQPVALRAQTEKHTWKVYFCHQYIRTITT